MSPHLRAISLALIPVQILTVCPLPVTLVASAVATGTSQESSPKLPTAKPPPDPTAGIKVNRTVPKVTLPTTLHFSENPTDDEFFRIQTFSASLVPAGGKTSTDENNALAAAILDFVKAADPEQTICLTRFLDRFPRSAWRASLLANLGVIYRSTGYWSKALDAWEQSWKLLSRETAPRTKALGDDVLGNVAQLNARLGRFERLKQLFVEIENRDVRGPATEKIAGAKEGFGLMQNRPQDAFRCGPMALQRILFATNKSQRANKELYESRSTKQGMSLTEVNDLAGTLGMNYQMARRLKGAPVIYPAVVNWKVGHFAALTKEIQGKFLSQDPTCVRRGVNCD